ncbi:GA-binding protein subunit beta-1 [Agrilus planipennis]|uniref:GA-binding protein subunit beta-1 n=1 Tax=Agrilus planipennis TaxID=224129 RepID=A0A1W4WNX5_AGRPL|nr:GA-binding protein subunit beta-1 [Agrilus planipennis]
MLKVPVLDMNLDKSKKDTETTSKYVLTNNELLTIENNGANGQVPQITWVTELGKQLLKAASEGNTEEIRLLVGKGAPFTADWLGTSPLHLAAQNNHLDVCCLLLRAGISKDARTKVDRTPLHMAAYKGHYEIVECLLTNGAEVNCKDLLGMTPLHWAVQNAHIEVVSLLIRYGADTQAVNKFELSPLDIAMQIQKHDIADIISATLTTNENFQAANESSNDSGLEPTSESRLSENDSSFPIETILLEGIDGESINAHCENDAGIFNSLFPKQTNTERLFAEEEDSQNENESEEQPQETSFIEEKEDFSETVKLLQQHGITMLPPDDSNIFTSVMDTGHQVVLTDIGKEMLNSTKPVAKIKPEAVKIATKVHQKLKSNSRSALKTKEVLLSVTPEEFLAMTTNLNAPMELKKVENFNCVSKPTTKRIVMKKSKVIPVVVNNNNNNNAVNKSKKSGINVSDMELLMTQLIEVKRQATVYKRQAEEYKSKLLMKEAEAKMYKQKLIALQRNCYCS